MPPSTHPPTHSSPKQVLDGYCIKYLATVVALTVYAVPIYLRDPSARGGSGELAQDYISAMRLLQNTSRRAREGGGGRHRTNSCVCVWLGGVGVGGLALSYISAMRLLRNTSTRTPCYNLFMCLLAGVSATWCWCTSASPAWRGTPPAWQSLSSRWACKAAAAAASLLGLRPWVARV